MVMVKLIILSVLLLRKIFMSLVTLMFTVTLSVAAGPLFGFWNLSGSTNAAASHSLNTSLVGYWKLDETSGTRADSSPVAAPITLSDNNSVLFGTGVNGNGALFVAATSQYLSAADATNFSMGDIDFSISAWVKLNSTLTDQTFVSHYLSTGNQRAYLIGYVAATTQFRMIVSATGSSTIGTVLASTTTEAGKWYHIVGIHDATSNTIVLVTNGITAGSTSHTTGVKDSTGAFAIGAIANPLQYTDGIVDEVGLWKKVLSPTEISTLRQTNLTCCPFVP